MKRPDRMTIRMLWATLLLAGAFCAGCGKDSEVFTADYQIKRLFGGDPKKSPKQLAAAAFNEKDPDIRRSGIEGLSQKSWALREPYLKYFSRLTDPRLEPDVTVRAVSVRTLGRAHATKYQEEINRALDDPSPVVRCDAATVLDEMPSDDVISRLRSLVIDVEEPIDVRAAAAKALRHYRTDEVYKTLLRALDDDDFTLRDAAHKSLVYMTGQDHGYSPERWAKSPDQVGKETLPEQVVRYKKRPWWDWMKITRESESVHPDAARREEEKKKRKWWKWGRK
ncbi:MAG: HEAT repeat domain-containing protein [Phycisphaerae bacterium]|nr:HEAT repeat domain-containing protein [Phycisphaerae bacterium]